MMRLCYSMMSTGANPEHRLPTRPGLLDSFEIRRRSISRRCDAGSTADRRLLDLGFVERRDSTADRRPFDLELVRASGSAADRRLLELELVR